ncbi:MAG: hypothetical protein WBL20_17120 [Sphingobium sp.]|uniref:hypothetical protein n=1 Tax=Sphingobium sp. TaxID=1912891 RepID=UPI003BB0C26F
MTRCQICGRRRNLRRDGMMAHHHVRAQTCPGTGFPPIEQDDGRLVQLLAETQEQGRRLTRELAAFYDRRANYIDPALIAACSRAVSLSLQLERRLTRHRAWPARFARQMERQGWGDPPPDYLRQRMEARP